MNNILVSVCIITYNSSKYVLETLESIKAQTYQDIELIVSDDGSKDNTIEIVKHWIDNNKSRFINAKLITSNTNTGVSANCNRAIKAAKGEWIKTLAGDDKLSVKSIEEFVKFTNDNSDCEMCLCRLGLFGSSDKHKKYVQNYLNNIYQIIKVQDRRYQYHTALERHIFPGPAAFYKKSLWARVGGYDENYITEEFSFELRFLQKTSIFFLDKELVLWRLREDSLSNSSFNPIVEKENIKLYFRKRRWLIIKEHMFRLLLRSDYYMLVKIKNYFIYQFKIKKNA